MERRIDDQRPSAPLEWEAKHAAMERAGELPLERRVAERRKEPPALVTVMAETIVALENQVSNLQAWLADRDSALHAPEFTEAQIAAAGRALADASAADCNIDKDDNWKIYGDDFIADARLAAAAIRALASQPAAPVQPLSIEAIRKLALDLCATDAEDQSEDFNNGRAYGVAKMNAALMKLAAPPVQQPGDVLNGGMHASIFVKVWGDAGGGDEGRIALANYAFDLGVKSTATTRPSAALTAEEMWHVAAKECGTEISAMKNDQIVLECPANVRDLFNAILAASGGALAVPEGYVVVPIKDTPAMNEAYNNIVTSGFGGSPAHSSHVWEAMISAAPATPAQGQTK